jgi:hypothetical protein
MQEGSVVCLILSRSMFPWNSSGSSPGYLAPGFGLSRATAYRYHEEGLRVLSDQAPDLQGALERAKRAGVAYLIIDGTIISCDRLVGRTLGHPPGQARDHRHSHRKTLT